MMPLAFLALFQTTSAPREWYGPAPVTFHVTFSGNPYDFEKVEMRVRFIDGKGNKVERLAYYDEQEAAWKAVLLSDHPGKYRAILVRNGSELDMAGEPQFVDLPSKPMAKGFIHRDPVSKNRLRFDDGTPYMPVGFNLGWQDPRTPDLVDMLKSMGKNGVNWSRIWACNWDGKNPWWPNRDNQLEAGSQRMWSDAFVRWDKLVSTSEEAGVHFQFVLFNHGSFSTRVNPNWQDHPWNAAKGGFLKKAADFFTDPEAKKRAKMWLRYAVARYGHSPSVLAWELFNEVEWVDARYEDRWKDVLAWHKEMADYVRSIDPYNHLITTSSTFEQPNLFDSVDYYQPHTYPADVRTAISYQNQPGDKPLFFGEFGPGVLDMKGQRMVVRDGIWAGLLSGQAGGGCFWSWDVVEGEKLYDEFKKSSAVLDASGLKDHPGARPVAAKVATAGFADLTFAPGAGWAKATKTSFEVEPGRKPEGLGGLPSFLQGPGHRDMFPEPLKFSFKAPKAGQFTLTLSSISKGGAHLKLALNGQAAADKKFEASNGDHPTTEKLVVPYKAGANVISIENVEGDWVTVRSFGFSGLDVQASAQAIGQVNWLMVRITANGSENPAAATLSALGLAPGSYEMTTFNLEDGASTKRTVKVEGATHAEKVELPSRDAVVVLKAN